MPERRLTLRTVVFFLLAGSFLAGCAGKARFESSTQWNLTHVRLYDPVDSAHPGTDIVACYARLQDSELQIRIDWLDHPLLPAFDLYLAIDDKPGGIKTLVGSILADIDWDTLVQVPATGDIQSLDAGLQGRADLALRITRDPVFDAVVIHMDGAALFGTGSPNMPFIRPPGNPKFQIVLIEAAGSSELDRSPPFALHDKPRAAAPLLLAFADVFPAYTPALALRRWDGAHSGPNGSRHGLFNLLRAAYGDLSEVNAVSLNTNRDTPLFLLDINTPASLPALDFAQALPLIRALSRSNRLVLADFQPAVNVPAAPYRDWLMRRQDESHRRIVQEFGLAPGNFLFTSSGWSAAGDSHPVVFVDQHDADDEIDRLEPAAAASWRGKILLPFPHNLPVQATPAGPSMELRTALVETALLNQDRSKGPAQILLLGGELPASTWGDPASARVTLRYLESRPWIDLLDAAEVSTLSPGMRSQTTVSDDPLSQQESAEQAGTAALVEALLKAPSNVFTAAAWQAYDALHATIHPQSEDLLDLRLNYLGPAWILLEAAGWLESPYSISTCELDLDRDGQLECLLASPSVFSAYEIESGALVALFTRQLDPGGEVEAHQLVGPTSQLITGLSDPHEWERQGSSMADPSVIPGAFSLRGFDLQAEPLAGRLLFRSTESQLVMRYDLLPEGISFTLESSPGTISGPMTIPVLFDPWQLLQPNWIHKYGETKDGATWRLLFESQTAVEVTASADITSDSYLPSVSFAGYPEDPNIDFGRGHYLPFPVFLLTIPGHSTWRVDIRLK